MASASSTNIPSETIPQWKKDLIQRRRQQTKVLANNGASVKLCTAVIGTPSDVESFDNSGSSTVSGQECSAVGNDSDSGGVGALVRGGSNSGSASGCSGGARALRTSDSRCVGVQHLVGTNISATDGGFGQAQPAYTVAANMRLETDVLSSDSDYILKSLNKVVADNKPESRDVAIKLKTGKSSMEIIPGRDQPASEDGESDSSEELQYGPGIVNRLKSKYLNLTLRETNKSRPTVPNFRRATSLEDLLDCDDDPEEKSSRKYTKRNSANIFGKPDRYRNATRGNETVKRARSVETLLRYNTPLDEEIPRNVPSRFSAGIPNQEPTNDHIILIDRSSVRIENKLNDLDRPKPLNKPKRVKLVVDETERPPPDLVKTTMRLFEGSTKKLKPKGEVAVKVATFKTINDTFKAQNQKKIIPKPPLQPKPFANGVKMPSSPKKTVPAKLTVEILEDPEFHNEGVVTEPIVRSVSSVVSKFQQIEKSLSPSPSPEPACKPRLSPVASPEPPLDKFESESKMRSPPSTPEPKALPSLEILPPRIPSPPSHDGGHVQQSSMSVQKQSRMPLVKELTRQTSSSQSSESIPRHQNIVDDSGETPMSSSNRARPRSWEEQTRTPDNQKQETVESPLPIDDDMDEKETVDGQRSISRAALENISKAGTTIKFSFKDKSESTKSYLPGANQNNSRSLVSESSPTCIVENQDITDDLSDEIGSDSNVHVNESDMTEHIDTIADTTVDTTLESAIDLPERSEASNGDAKYQVEIEDHVGGTSLNQGELRSSDNKPIGAISSLGFLKSTATSPPYGQRGEPKLVKISQKIETSSPQKQIGIIRPLVSTKTQHPQQNLSSREMEKNLINRVKSIEQPTKVVVSLKSADEIQPVKKNNSNGGGSGLWDTKPWNDQNNTMVFNFSNRKEVPDYIENDGLRMRRKRSKPKVGDGSVIVLDATLDASTTDEAEWEMTGGPPSPCNVSFLNDNILINGRSNLSKQPRNHKLRIKFDDTATQTFEYPSEASMLVGEGSNLDAELMLDRSDGLQDSTEKRPPSVSPTPPIPSILGGGGLASYTPSKVDLASEGFELGVTRVSASTTTVVRSQEPESLGEEEYLKPARDGGAWGSETTADLLF